VRERNKKKKSNLDGEAASWVIKNDRGLTERETADFEKRKSEDPRVEEAVSRSEEAWNLLDRVPLDTRREFLDEAESGPFSWRFPWWRELSAGVAALVIAALIWWTGNHAGFFSAGSWFSNEAAQAPTTRLLPDGSMVRLNAGAEIDVAFSKKTRNIHLKTGEAHFKVKSDPDRPFVVFVDKLQVRAVGTAFNVRNDFHRLDVIVTDGTVQIFSDDEKETTGSGAPTSQGEAAVVPFPTIANYVKAGQRAQVQFKRDENRVELSISDIKTPEVNQALAWQGSLLTLGGDSLDKIAENFERKTGLKLIVEDPDLSDLRIGGRFPSDDPKGFLKVMESNYGIQWHERPDGTLVIGESR